jgi:DNA-binding transcriptional LysR family regulator
MAPKKKITAERQVWNKGLEVGKDDWYAAAPHSNLIVRSLASYRMVICASRGYLAKHGLPEHPSELRRKRCVKKLTDAPEDAC